MNKIKRTERGQALILITFAIIGLIAITGLTVDGGIAYSDRRNAQNAADTAAYAGALAHVRNNDVETAGLSVATSNGYTGNVVITTAVSPAGVCPPQTNDNIDVTVTITSVVQTTFGRAVGVETMTNVVTATARACGTYLAPIFDGQAVVGLRPSGDCAFDSGESNSAKWKIKGSGIFSNGCAYSKNSDSVTFETAGQCAVAVGTASNFTCSQSDQSGKSITYPDDVLAIMPPNPCDGSPGDVGLAQPSPSGGSVVLSNGVYCITDFDEYDSTDIILNNATLYVTDTDFNLKFAGGGGFSGTPTASGDYNSYFMVIAYDPTPCDDFNDNNAQVLQYRGNSGGDPLYGTVLAPSACIDFRGNPDGSAINSQIIGYMVSSNGTADVYVEYDANENRRDPDPAVISLVE